MECCANVTEGSQYLLGQHWLIHVPTENRLIRDNVPWNLQRSRVFSRCKL